MQHALMLKTRRIKQKHAKELARAARLAKKAGKEAPKAAPKKAAA
jgi:hypothetical protein